jgi:hypothetical protein
MEFAGLKLTREFKTTDNLWQLRIETSSHQIKLQGFNLNESKHTF